jgi:DNA-binding response OmpR family regulator
MKRILVIEDDPDIALSLRVTLEREGGFRSKTRRTAQAG